MSDIEIKAVLHELARSGLDGGEYTDQELWDRAAARLAALRDEAIAAELATVATFYWDAAALNEPMKQVADSQGEEHMAALLDSQIRMMREVARRLNARAAAVRGVSQEELAMRSLLTLPTESGDEKPKGESAQ